MLKEFGLALVFALVVVVGIQFLFPANVAYATSDSMAPAIHEGDAYLVVETAAIDRGDVITFSAPDQGEPVTHRVVQHTAEGYITQGDANPSTDQAAGTPPVPATAVIGKVVELNGHPLTIPAVGRVLHVIEAHHSLVVAGAIAVLALDLATLMIGRERTARRDLLRVGDFVTPLLVGGFVVCLALVMVAGGVHDVTYVATGEETSAPQTVPVGEPAERTVTIDAERSPLTTLYVHAEGVEVVDRTRAGSSVELTVRVPPQETVGPHVARIGIYQYPRTLPRSVLASLHDVHWLAAAIGSLTPVFGPLAAMYLLVLDAAAPIRFRRGWRDWYPGRG